MRIEKANLVFFRDKEIYDAIIEFDYDGETLSISSIEGEFYGITEQEAIDFLENDFSKIKSEIEEEINNDYEGCPYDNEVN